MGANLVVTRGLLLLFWPSIGTSVAAASPERQASGVGRLVVESEDLGRSGKVGASGIFTAGMFDLRGQWNVIAYVQSWPVQLSVLMGNTVLRDSFRIAHSPITSNSK